MARTKRVHLVTKHRTAPCGTKAKEIRTTVFPEEATCKGCRGYWAKLGIYHKIQHTQNINLTLEKISAAADRALRNYGRP